MAKHGATIYDLAYGAVQFIIDNGPMPAPSARAALIGQGWDRLSAESGISKARGMFLLAESDGHLIVTSHGRRTVGGAA